MKLNKVINSSWIVCLPINASFSINGLISPFMVTTLLFVAHSLILSRYSSTRVTILQSIFALLPIHAILLSSLLFNVQTVVYLSTLILVYLLVPFSFQFSLRCNGIVFFDRFNAIAVLLASLFAILEFSFNLIGFNVHSLVPRSIDHTLASANIAGVYMRSYSFSTEPSVFAYYLITLGSIAALYLINKRKYLFACVIPLALMTTFSASTFGSLLLASVILAFLSLLKKLFSRSLYRSINHLYLYALLPILLILATSLFLYLTDNPAFLAILAKLSFTDLSSGSGRLEVWSKAFRITAGSSFTPHGVGWLSSIDFSVISTYFMILIEQGPLALLSLILPLFYFAYYFIVSRLNQAFTWHFFFIIASFVQIASFSVFYFPFLIILCIYADYHLRNVVLAQP